MRDMLEAACEVVEFTQGRTWDDYRDSKQLRRSVERSIEIIGEAARRVTRATQSKHPQIPWDRVIPTRHRLAHEYDSLDDSIVWSIATKHVPPLIQSLKAILPPDPVDPG
ncbi:MAG: HepT-like ribonuclease domain-containing protein [Planctomycetota bacterium]|nr:HepT-like ribonuclease domain-containing protein [Planctomycetota bacterium]